MNHHCPAYESGDCGDIVEIVQGSLYDNSPNMFDSNFANGRLVEGEIAYISGRTLSLGLAPCRDAFVDIRFYPFYCWRRLIWGLSVSNELSLRYFVDVLEYDSGHANAESRVSP